MLERSIEVVAGLIAVGVLLVDIFQSIILPRGASFSFRPSARSTRALWALCRQRAKAFTDPLKREGFLATFAPFTLVWLLVMWIAGLILSYGLVFYGLRDQLKPVPGFLDAVYFAGTSLLTIGYGDFAPMSHFARLISLCAGASGFGVVAVGTTFFYQIVSSFQTREVFVTRFASRAGAPASGVTLLETYGKLGIHGDLEQLFYDAEPWCAMLLDSHIAFPILTFFRSSHDYESWLGTLGALLDASTLSITAIADLPHGQAKMFNMLGRHTVRDLSEYFNFDEDGTGVGIERAEFDAACARLKEAGYVLTDLDQAWPKFVTLRETYAGALNDMARWWDIPPAQWIGDRSMLARFKRDGHGHVAGAPSRQHAGTRSPALPETTPAAKPIAES